MPKTSRPIAIYHEHQEWFRPLFAEMDRRGTPYVRVDARRHHYDIAARERDYALVFNRTIELRDTWAKLQVGG